MYNEPLYSFYLYYVNNVYILLNNNIIFKKHKILFLRIDRFLFQGAMYVVVHRLIPFSSPVTPVAKIRKLNKNLRQKIL